MSEVSQAWSRRVSSGRKSDSDAAGRSCDGGVQTEVQESKTYLVRDLGKVLDGNRLGSRQEGRSAYWKSDFAKVHASGTVLRRALIRAEVSITHGGGRVFDGHCGGSIRSSILNAEILCFEAFD